MRQVFANAEILEGEDLEVTRGYLVVKDGVITEISEGSPSGRATNLKHGFIIPPFVNAHTHVMDSVAKELYIGRSQPEVVGLGGVKFRALESAGKNSLISAAKATLQDMFKTGTLAHCDFREGGVEGVKILRSFSKPPLKSSILSRPSSLDEIEQVLAVADGLGLPSLDFMEQKNLAKASRMTKKSGKIFALHVAETAEAQALHVKKTGVTEVESALKLNPTFVVHVTHSTEKDMKLLKKSGIPVIFCPRANSLLGAGLPPIAKALELGVPFCVGTDNAMVCQPDMFEELRFAWAILRCSDPSAGRDEARELLISATLRPAQLLGLPWGPVEKGKPAAFVAISRGKNLANVRDVFSGIVNRARAENVRAVIAGFR
ncbi:MAG: amidohydrolase family protein [Candidatus Hadarchaeota archaeon]